MKNQRQWRKGLVLVCGLAAGAIGLAAARTTTPVPGDVDEVRATLSELVETRRTISKERSEWAEGRELLQARIDLLAGEAGSLKEREGEAQGSIAEADKKRVELLAENERYKQSAAGLEEVVGGLEARTKALLMGVPVPLAERVEPLSQRLVGADVETKLSLSERFQNVVGILNELNKFQREVSVFNEIREVSGGSTREVMTLYLGLGVGYYVSPDGALAGHGQAVNGKWTWTADDSLGPAVSQAIAVYKNEEPAAFVQLPVHLDERGGDNQ